MAKNIIKEIIIVLLLCLAIILILGVLLYEYVPTNKVIPEKVSYVTPEKVKEELNKADSANIITTYEYNVEASDLNNYKRVSDYVPGKQNPFSSYNAGQTQTTGGENTSTGSSSTTTGNSSNSANNNSNSNTSAGANTNASSEGSYIPNHGTK